MNKSMIDVDELLGLLVEEQKRRLRWHCRRGMLELDVLLGPFLEDAYEALSDMEKTSFVYMLNAEDPDLFQWLTEKCVPDDPAVARLVNKVLKRVKPS